MRTLITGGRGQLGRALQEALALHQVFAVGHAEMDVTDADAVRRAVDELRPELVIHAAAWTDTAGCESDPERALLVNGEGTRHVAEACTRAGADMLYVSTNEVFDGETAEPYREEDAPNPINAYARSKLAGERYVQSTTERYYIVRTAWLYGPGRVSFPEKVLQAAAKTNSLKGVTDEVASPTGEPPSQQEYGAPYRKPAFSALANVNAAGLGIELRPWQEALKEHLRRSRSGAGVEAPAPQVNR